MSFDLSNRALRQLLNAAMPDALYAIYAEAIPTMAQEILDLRTQVVHWKANHTSVVEKKRKGHEITSKLIADLRLDVEKAHERIAELEAQIQGETT